MRLTRVPCKVTRCIKLQGLELTLRSTVFHAPENLIFPAMISCEGKLERIEKIFCPAYFCQAGPYTLRLYTL